MMPREILRYPHPGLRQKAKEVKELKDVKELLEDMWITMYEFKGIGLAAPQIGENKQIFVADVEGKRMVLINPRILTREGEERGEEGCLSIPEVTVEIPRAKRIEVEGWNEKGEKIREKFEGLLARVIQHEIDHLHGTLILDYLSPYEKERLIKKLREEKK